jgi:cytochrome c peroxidase
MDALFSTRRGAFPAAAVLAAAVAATAVLCAAGRIHADEVPADQLTFSDPSGVQQTVTTAGSIDAGNPFFQNLGTNGRACSSCHRADSGWTITPAEVRDRFERTGGLDPIFRTNDGSTCEGADISTQAKRRDAFTLLMTKGLIRVGMSVPEHAEFAIVDVDDPYACGAPLSSASLYRRPLPSTNLQFLSTVMWDGRETVKGASIHDDLAGQARDATIGHAQGAAPSAAQVEAIVAFESALFTAQIADHGAGRLDARGASGGPAALTTQPFCLGVNDPLNLLPSAPGACSLSSGGLDPSVFTLFVPWSYDESPARQAIARGERLFNTRTFVIDNVPGLNGGPGDPLGAPIASGTCTVCHDTPNAGNHSIALPIDIGVAAASRRTPDLPLYTLRNTATGQTVQTTDPGRAMVTGRWADIGKFKGPTLRGLAARAPYFHNGSAATIADAVAFYNARFHIGLTPQESMDLVAFLESL